MRKVRVFIRKERKERRNHRKDLKFRYLWGFCERNQGILIAFVGNLKEFLVFLT